MKQHNGWTRNSSRGGANSRPGRRHPGSFNSRGGRPFNHNSNGRPGGKSFFYEHMASRINFTFKNCAGKKVRVKKSNGIILEGIFIASGNESGPNIGVTLKYVTVTHRPENVTEQFKTGEDSTSIPWQDIIFVSAIDVTPRTLKTDAEIARKNIQAGKLSNRTLQTPDAGWLQDSGKNGSLEAGGKAGEWNQFEVNEKKFGIKASFDENLYTTPLNKASLTPEQIKKAEKVAKEIESNSVNNRLQESGKTEEQRFSSVERDPPPPPKPMNFAAALMKGKLNAQNQTKPPHPPKTTIGKIGKPANFPSNAKLPPPNSPSKLSTPAKPAPGKDVDEVKKSNQNTSKSKSRLAKYRVQEVDFDAVIKRTQLRFQHQQRTPTSKNWESHNHTKNKYELSASKTRARQIKEFKEFSSSLGKKKVKDQNVESRKQLNVNAKEFKPPVADSKSKPAPNSQNPRPEIPSQKPQNVKVGQQPGPPKAGGPNQPPLPQAQNSRKNNSIPQVHLQGQPQNAQNFMPQQLQQVPMQQFGYPVMQQVMMPQPQGQPPMFQPMIQNPQFIVPPPVQGQYFVPVMHQMPQPGVPMGGQRVFYSQVPGMVQMQGQIAPQDPAQVQQILQMQQQAQQQQQKQPHQPGPKT